MSTLVVVTVVLLALIASGVWVAVALGVASVAGLYPVFGFERLISLFGKMAWQQSTSFVLIALPLFIFMGEVLSRSGMMQRIYSATSRLVDSLPGGLLQTNVAAGTLFAACTGSSLASAATIGSVGYPLIAERGYHKRMALGSIAAGGTLGILIPPSIIFIIYGGLAEVSIGKLFIAGVIPGLLLAFVYGAYIAIRAMLEPGIAPREPRASGREILAALRSLWPVGALATVVFGGIYGGIATPTEVAGLAAALALLFAAMERKLTWPVIREAALNSVRQTSMILLIVTMAKLLSLALIYHQVPSQMVAWVNTLELERLWVIVAVLLIYVVMGLFFEGASMMVITVPFVVPIMTALGVDLIWLGVLICITIEIGLLTPPVGLNLFVMRAATGEPLHDVVRGSVPFVALQVLVLVLVLFFPGLALFLVSEM